MIVVQAEDNDRREKNLEEAKKITIENDPSLPKPDTVGFCVFRPESAYQKINPCAPECIVLNRTDKCEQVILRCFFCLFVCLLCRLKSTSWRLKEVSGSKCLDGFIASEDRVRSVGY